MMLNSMQIALMQFSVQFFLLFARIIACAQFRPQSPARIAPPIAHEQFRRNWATAHFALLSLKSSDERPIRTQSSSLRT